MLGMMMLTFILFFAFVINTGMLVNAKINLQNAADLGAYAGAAVQARQLNSIAYLNYEMRRQYKKFLFRYYVIGNMAQDTFPRAPSGGRVTRRRWSPNKIDDYNVPAVCLIFNERDNFCHLAVQPGIKIPPRSVLDPINNALTQQLKRIENVRQKNCLAIGASNDLALKLWLWNTDPNLEGLLKTVSADQAGFIKIIQGLSRGLGLIPKEILLNRRIKTLTRYVNFAPRTGVTLEDAEGLRTNPALDTSEAERTIQAFKSAYLTLGNHTFDDPDQITMDELMPKEILKLDTKRIQFDTYAIAFTLRGGVTPPTSVEETNEENCVVTVTPEIVNDLVPLGVAKDPKILTYYAIRLTAKAKILFSPFGDVTLKAYSAAKPFGSRIGPPLDQVEFTRDNVELKLGLSGISGIGVSEITRKIPNLAIRKDDKAQTGQGWDTDEMLGAMYAAFFKTGALPAGRLGGPGIVLTPDDIERGYQVAMAPNPWEGNVYNIMNDEGTDQFVHNFDSQHIGAVWAPILPPSDVGNLDAEIERELDELMPAKSAEARRFKDSVKQSLLTYLAEVQKGAGEDGESFKVAKLTNPFVIRPPRGREQDPPEPINLPEGLGMRNPAEFKTSWNQPYNENLRAEGRVGYSVKFISFDSLSSPQKILTDGKNPFSNDITQSGDGELPSDLPFIKH